MALIVPASVSLFNRDYNEEQILIGYSNRIEDQNKLFSTFANAGITSILVAGTNGEGLFLSSRMIAERVKLASNFFESTYVVARGGFIDASYVARQAIDVKAAGIVVTTEGMSSKTSQILQFQEFLKLVKGTGTGLALYNLPSRFPKIEVETVAELLENDRHQTCRVIKDSSGDLDYLKRLIALKTIYPHLKVFCGSDNDIYNALLLGCDGIISGGCNIYPRLLAKLVNYFNQGNLEEAKKCQEKINLILEICRKYARSPGSEEWVVFKAILNFKFQGISREVAMRESTLGSQHPSVVSVM